MSEERRLQLPLGWSLATIGDLTHPRGHKADPQANPEKRFIGMEHVEAQTMRLLGTLPCSSMKSGANVFFPTDVLYGRLRSYLNKVFQPEFPGLCSGEFIVLPESSAVLGRFLKYRLNAGDFVAFASRLNGGDRPRVDFDQIKGFATPLPPRREQERIADALDELLSDLDAGVAALERVQAKLTLYRASVLKAAAEGALTAEWRAQHPTVEPASQLLDRILAERRRLWEEAQLAKFKARGQEPPKSWKARYKEAASPDGKDLPQLPDGWCWTSLEALVVEGPQNGLYLPSTRYGSGVAILRIEDFQNGWVRSRDDLNTVQADLEETASYALRQGDLVINRVNSMTHLGKCLVVGEQLQGALFESNMMRAKVSSLVDAEYVESYLQSELGRRRLTKDAKWAVNQASINQEDVKRTLFPLPPLAEQQSIVELVEDQMSVIDHLEADIDAKLKSAQSLRQAILRHAFSGKLVPQDPNDEPASELLMRIAAEREARAREAGPVKGKARRVAQRKTP